MDSYFIFKKIIGEVMSPLSIGMLLATIGLLSLYFSRYKQAKVLLSIAMVWMLLVSYGPVSDALMKPLESQYEALHITPLDVNYVLVLGNAHFSSDKVPVNAQLNPVALMRLSEGLRHLNNMSEGTLVVSGYAGFVDSHSHAFIQKSVACSLGVSEADIVMFEDAVDTMAEAKAMKDLVGDAPFILVTSASHMPRAMMIFEKAGLHPYAAPTDFHYFGQSNYLSYPSVHSLQGTEIAFHEYYGLIWRWMKSW